MKRLRITEYIDLDLGTEEWRCNRCGTSMGPARRPYKEGCLVRDRDPREIHQPVSDAPYNYSIDPVWTRIVEFYCPGCGTLVENEYLPPGHPLTWDIDLDLDQLRARVEATEP